MKILVVGGGGREHAIIKSLKKNPEVETIYATPGNGGIAADAVCVNIGATDIDGIVHFAKKHAIDYAVVAPDDPLVLGCVDALNEVGIPCFGPKKDAAIIEGSKAFSKNLMKKYGIPTARYEIFTDLQAALDYLQSAPIPTVIKADGLALGKGVIIAQTCQEACDAVTDMMANAKFGKSGSTVVIEEFLTGPEVSVLAFTDGKCVKPMVSSMDHKRAGDNDTGLNTGGMGTVAPNPYYTEEIARRCMEEIFLPTIQAMNEEGRTFTGCLYFGLMLTPDGPKVIEYNCRFGDPETQVVLPLLQSDLLTVMQATTNGTLEQTPVQFADRHACCVITASAGYPESYKKGFAITMTEEAAAATYVAGAKLADGKLVTSGGRVTGTTAIADSLEEAIRLAYSLADGVVFENAYRRSDIGQRALAAHKLGGIFPMVYRVYVEKKPGQTHEADGLLREIRDFLQIEALQGLRVLNRYDVENIEQALFDYAVGTVFSEPQVDDVSYTVPEGGTVFAVEPLPGQFDQRADSAAQCIQILSQGERPLVRSAKVYVLDGELTEAQIAAIKKHVINAVESREASLALPETLAAEYAIPSTVATVEGFTAMDSAQLSELLDKLGLAMDLDDLKFLQNYFRDDEHRDPTITEIRVVDTYWSDHCRHTTFSTHIDEVQIHDKAVQAAYERYLAARVEVYGEEKAAKRPQTLMDIATIGAKTLKKRGMLPELDESEEINACSIHVTAKVNGEAQDWLLMFKNETHNHPTEIEPFGGAATCIGGCIRDPLSGRAYVHQAMRVTGAGDPRKSMAETLPGKLPQRKLCQTAAAGYSSYGNQIGLATGHVAELYHEGYIAKRLECGAVVAAAPAGNVRRERPAPGDVVILLGGRTGRDGIGGATGSSKSHNAKSLTTMASEVQKGNAPEERKIQRLFRNGEVTRLIKRCNDFGAGGVSVAIGELADGLVIDLDAVRKKYDGLDGTELAISESQERMAVVVEEKDAAAFIAAAQAENLEAYRVAVVTEEARMVMNWKGHTIANLSRAFLDTNGASKHTAVVVEEKDLSALSKPLYTSLRQMASDLKTASRRGLVERFDSTIGAGSLLMPYGGRNQRTPAQAMAALLPTAPGETTEQGSVFSWGCDPDHTSLDPYTGAHAAVYTSMAKLVAAGADYWKAYLTLQEFFEKLRTDPKRWGKPFAALLGALDAQLELGAAAIGGKDSMSGTFLDKDVPPTVISFAIAPIDKDQVLSPEFKEAGHPVYLFGPTDESADSLKAAWEYFHQLHLAGKVKAAWAVENGLGEAVLKMSFGNSIGFNSCGSVGDQWHQSAFWGFIVAELTEDVQLPGVMKIGQTTNEPVIDLDGDRADISELLALNEGVLEQVYPTRTAEKNVSIPVFGYNGGCSAAPIIKTAKPKVLIPVFPGTNCEYDSARAVERAGGEAEIFVVRNLTADDVARSVEAFAEKIGNSQMIFIPGGFSGGDEPDGSAKFITAFFRNAAVKEQVTKLLDDRDGLMLGICNGFQALIKLGLVPYGKIIDTDDACPTLTYNTIARHQSMLVRTRVCTNNSPWLAGCEVGQIVTVPISHGEGRFFASEDLALQLAANGQIATQYVDLNGDPTMDTAFNPNGSLFAIEGITSPDGRVLGKMGHSERWQQGIYRNVPGDYDMKLFESAVKYFK